MEAHEQASSQSISAEDRPPNPPESGNTSVRRATKRHYFKSPIGQSIFVNSSTRILLN